MSARLDMKREREAKKWVGKHQVMVQMILCAFRN